ncbi:MAG TPA: hypothetical protein DCQ64_30695 [Candidatus Rokubacteria bacterium]|nr:hypothetical protein [Candidatus Rokubacteria bacterium]
MDDVSVVPNPLAERRRRRAAQSRAWRAANADRVKAYKLANKDRANAQKRARYAADPTKEREASRRWRAINPDAAKATNRRWRDAHPDIVLGWRRADYYRHQETNIARNRAYYLAHAEESNAANKVWREANSAHTRAYNQARYRANKEALAARIAAWAAANPERYRKYKAEARQRRRARLAGVPQEPIDRDVVYERDNGRCGLCGRRVARTDMSIDHIIPIIAGGPHTYANIQLAHLSCNSRRGHRGPAQMRLTI